jgi:hypothetical protein
MSHKLKLKSAKELGITTAQRRNIARLTVFVRDSVPPPKFDIKTFHTASSGEQCQNPSEAKYSCGSSACFLGYGPLAGMKPQGRESWYGYAQRFFASHEFGEADGSMERYAFLFSVQHKNSKVAAIKRGAWLLTHGLPEGEFLEDWEAPKSFRPNWKLIEEAAK